MLASKPCKIQHLDPIQPDRPRGNFLKQIQDASRRGPISGAGGRAGHPRDHVQGVPSSPGKEAHDFKRPPADAAFPPPGGPGSPSSSLHAEPPDGKQHPSFSSVPVISPLHLPLPELAFVWLLSFPLEKRREPRGRDLVMVCLRPQHPVPTVGEEWPTSKGPARILLRGAAEGWPEQGVHTGMGARQLCSRRDP